jgi:hypothetical protein
VNGLKTAYSIMLGEERHPAGEGEEKAFSAKRIDSGVATHLDE